MEAAKQPLDTAGVTARLNDRGHTVSLAATRRILRLFEGKGYLTATDVRNSLPHKEYTLTAAGRRRARDARRKIGELLETLGELRK